MSGGGIGARTGAAATLGVVALATVASGCGSSVKTSANGQAILVAAASTFHVALPKFESSGRYEFGQPAQLEKRVAGGGDRSDVFISDGTALPAKLHNSAGAQAPVTFATDRLVLVVRHPSAHGKVQSLSDLSKSGVKIAIGAASTPLGSYTRKALARLPGSQAKKIEANVSASPSSASAILQQLNAGKVDAAIVYRSDAVPALNKVKATPLPPKLQPNVPCEAVVLKNAPHASLARKYVQRLREPSAQKLLRQAGFDPAP